MSTFYDDGGIKFAEEQFDIARKRRDKETKKQEKFSKNLQILNGLITGANYVINSKADKLGTENVLAKAHYLTLNENANMFNKEYNDYISQGFSQEDIFEIQTLDKLNDYILC